MDKVREELKRLVTWKGTLSRGAYVKRVLITLGAVFVSLTMMARSLLNVIGGNVTDEQVLVWIEESVVRSMWYVLVVLVGVYMLSNFVCRRFKLLWEGKFKWVYTVGTIATILAIQYLPNKESNALTLVFIGVTLLLGLLPEKKNTKNVKVTGNGKKDVL